MSTQSFDKALKAFSMRLDNFDKNFDPNNEPLDVLFHTRFLAQALRSFSEEFVKMTKSGKNAKKQ